LFITATDSHTQVAKKENVANSTTGAAAFYNFTMSSEALANNNYILNIVCDRADIPINLHAIRSDTTTSANQYSEANATYATIRDESP
jgi:hypothetical protein